MFVLRKMLMQLHIDIGNFIDSNVLLIMSSLEVIVWPMKNLCLTIDLPLGGAPCSTYVLFGKC